MHKYTTNIPAARIELNKIADQLDGTDFDYSAKEIRRIVEEKMTRRPGARRAPNQRNQVTDEITRSVLDDLRNTDLTQEDIARQYNIDGGRVSEIYRTMRN